jgi:hypothetical protein
MTSKNSSKAGDGADRSVGSASHEPGSEQALFIEKLRGAAQSATDVFSRTGNSFKGLEESKAKKGCAVQAILQGFSLEGTEKD